MNVSSEEYRKVNGAQIRDALETIQKIKRDNFNKKFDRIVDIGCGDGRVTQLLAQSIPHHEIYAIDLIPEMVEASRKLNGNSFIQFLQQDISSQWTGLDPQLRSLEGQVDLLWSNRVLHWIPEELKSRAAANIVNLLKPGGLLYINTTLVVDFLQLLPEDDQEKKELEQIIQIPSLEEQQENWRYIFEKGGLKNVEVEYFAKEWEFESVDLFQKTGNYSHILHRYITEKNLENSNAKVIEEKLRDIFLRVSATPAGQNIVRQIDGNKKWFYGQFKITGKK